MLLDAMIPEVIHQAYDIAWEYLDGTGAIENGSAAHARLLSDLAGMYGAGMRNKLVMANKAIVLFKQAVQVAA